MNAPGTFYAPITDPLTVRTLHARHGALRATEIIAGRDPETAKDIAKWRTLGVGKRAYD